MEFVFRDKDEWEAYKVAFDMDPKDVRDKGYWDSYKRQQREQAQAPSAQPRASRLVGDEDEVKGFGFADGAPLVGFGASDLDVAAAFMTAANLLGQTRQASLADARARQATETKRHQQEEVAKQQAILDSLKPRLTRNQDQYSVPKFRPWWHWLALLLLTALALACTAALVLGAISLATHAELWIIPAAAAEPVVLVAAFMLLLLLVAGLQYMSASSKSLGGGGGNGPLLPAGGRSDARPARQPASAPASYGQVLSADHGHPRLVQRNSRP